MCNSTGFGMAVRILNVIAVLALLMIAEDQEYPFSTDMVPSYCVCMHCRGPTGDQGLKGDRGTSGPPGRPGLRGTRGSRGSSGIRGPRGFRGIKGQKGARGPRGMMGLKGIQGRRGFRGLRGLRGFAGVNGRPGLKGSAGLPGQCPATCLNTNGGTGMKGDTGLRGPKGDRGESGLVGQPGSKGDPGNIGLKGNKGVEGTQGVQGEQGICNCVDGEKGVRGNVGPDGRQGVKGDQGPMGEQGNQGWKGEKGEQGNEGEVGPPGPCVPTIQSAFSASRNADEGLPSPYFPIPFTNVIYNKQGHFNPVVGVYIAPVNGTYIFSYHLSILKSPIKMGLFKNRKVIIKTANQSPPDQVSQTVILHLESGDKIWLQVKDSNFNGMYADQDTDSTFSGFLLYPDSCNQVISRTSPGFLDEGSGNYNPGFDSENPTLPADEGFGSGSGAGSGSSTGSSSGSGSGSGSSGDSSSGFGSTEPNPPNASEAP
uniref:complement C1q and tumor necrosis factor-related protein 9 isoform X2 n=1 Tax=Pristiophorus japonicus TaxID=55135 RepID=UPI00398E42EC